MICPSCSHPTLSFFTLQKLLPGALILGAVLEVHEFEVVFSLPFNMRGSVAISDVSDLLSQKLQSEADRLELEEEEVCKMFVC